MSVLTIQCNESVAGGAHVEHVINYEGVRGGPAKHRRPAVVGPAPGGGGGARGGATVSVSCVVTCSHVHVVMKYCRSVQYCSRMSSQGQAYPQRGGALCLPQEVGRTWCGMGVQWGGGRVGCTWMWCGVVWCGVEWCGVVWCGVGWDEAWCVYGGP